MSRPHPDPVEAVVARVRATYARWGCVTPVAQMRADWDALFDTPVDATVTPVDAGGVRCLPPTLLVNPPADLAVMRQEIFGPLLPIIPFNRIDEVIDRINADPKPLALYIFSTDKARTREIIVQTSSGGVAINHCVLHYAHGNLPFGGVNNSGIGNAHVCLQRKGQGRILQRQQAADGFFAGFGLVAVEEPAAGFVDL